GVALPEGDRYQYIEGWPSGYGLHELITEIDRLRAEDAITVYREGRWNVTAEGLEILYPASAQVRYCFIEAFPCAEGRGYLVVNRDEGWGLSERTRAALEEGIRIWSVSRPGGYTAIELWQLDAG